MSISKIPRNYYSDTDHRRDKTNEIIGVVNDLSDLPVLPTPGEGDIGKIPKVNSEGGYTLASDAGTVLPTPTSEDIGKVIKVDSNEDYALATDEGLPAVTSADNGKVLTVVNGIWSPELVIRNIDNISAMKITISNGGANSACLPPLTFNDPATGEVANLVVNTDYTMECSSSIVTGSLSLTGAPDVANANLPAVFDIDFINVVNIRKYSNIKMTNAVAFPYSLAKNIKIEVSADGVSFITVYEENTLDWTVSPKEFNIYGDPVSNLPIPTIADAGKVLGVDSNGDWELGNVVDKNDCVIFQIEFVETNKYKFSGYTSNAAAYADIAACYANNKMPVLYQKMTANKPYYYFANNGAGTSGNQEFIGQYVDKTNGKISIDVMTFASYSSTVNEINRTNYTYSADV